MLAQLRTRLDGIKGAGAEQFAEISGQSWSNQPLTADEARAAAGMMAAWAIEKRKPEAQKAWEAKSITVDGTTMKFDFRTFGTAPAKGRAMFISMHGGGSTTAKINDGQWKNQIRLYEPAEGVYIAPRAPTDSWNMWHQPHIDALFDRLIETAIVCAGVDPDHVYLMGYSAGGDGVYQLAPRMADRFAAAAMMAGHPNDAKPDGLRNLPFAIHMGGNDSAFNRNAVARQWGEMLDALRAADPKGYIHTMTLHEGKGHWMDRQDAAAVPWMAACTRETAPSRVVWVQSSTTHERFYWLGAEKPAAGTRLDVTRERNTFTVHPGSTAKEWDLLLNDDVASLDQPVRIVLPDGSVQEKRAARTIGEICRSLTERMDPGFIPVARVRVTLRDAAAPPGDKAASTPK